MDDLRRELHNAIIVFSIIVPLGIVGFMTLEGYSLLEAFYVTIITLTTIGYGDYSPVTTAGQIFTILLVIFGLSAVVNIGSTIIAFVSSPAFRKIQQQKRTLKTIEQLNNHFIICGMGEMVDKTVEYLLQFANARREDAQRSYSKRIDTNLERIFKHMQSKRMGKLRHFLHKSLLATVTTLRRQRTILDIVVVITSDADYAAKLRAQGLNVINGDPTNDNTLLDAGIERAQAMMVILDNDTEALLSVLTARSVLRNQLRATSLHITAAVIDGELSQKMTRVGANAIITPFDTAGQFLNGMTFRPAVNDFFHGLLFDVTVGYRPLQLEITEDCNWLGKRIEDLNLRDQFSAAVLGIRHDDATYGYIIEQNHTLQEDEILILVAPFAQIEHIMRAYRKTPQEHRMSLFQPLPMQHAPLSSGEPYSLVDAEQAIQHLSRHFVICGDDHVMQSALERLDPERPFAIISHDNTMTSQLLKRGFRVVHGDPTDEETLKKAGVERAQAMMVSLESKAHSVLTILGARALNRRLLITTTANSDDMVDKLERAGADRVISPFRIAAQYILLTTIQPEIASFLTFIQFNYRTQIETTEIYMEDKSDWIGKTIAELELRENYNAIVIGIRQEDNTTFIYAPPEDYTISAHEVLIIVTPMAHADQLRIVAHGGTIRRPETLRSRVLQSQKWTPEQLKQMLEQGRSS